MKRLKASLTVIAKNKNVKPAKNKSYGARSPTSSRLNKYTIKTRKLKKGRKLKSKFKKNVSKLKTKVFGFSRKRASKNKKSYFGRVPTGNYSSSQSPSSNRMIYYAPNKSSRYEWGSNSKAIKR